MNWVDELRRVLDRLRGQPPAEGAGTEGGVSYQEAADHLYEWLDGELDPEMARRVGTQIAVTYCPLTGASMVFDREAIAGAELGVSGLIFRNNLIRWDRRSEESLWPQMLASAGCGPARASSWRWSRHGK